MTSPPSTASAGRGDDASPPRIRKRPLKMTAAEDFSETNATFLSVAVASPNTRHACPEERRLSSNSSTQPAPAVIAVPTAHEIVARDAARLAPASSASAESAVALKSQPVIIAEPPVMRRAGAAAPRIELSALESDASSSTTKAGPLQADTTAPSSAALALPRTATPSVRPVMRQESKVRCARSQAETPEPEISACGPNHAEPAATA